MSIEVIDCAQGFGLDGEIKTTQKSSDQAPVMPTRTARRERSHKFKGNTEETEEHAKLVSHLPSFGLSPRFGNYLQTLSFWFLLGTSAFTNIRYFRIRKIKNTCSD